MALIPLPDSFLFLPGWRGKRCVRLILVTEQVPSFVILFSVEEFLKLVLSLAQVDSEACVADVVKMWVLSHGDEELALI